MIVAAQAKNAPKQCKLLGATVRDLGVIIAVSQRPTWAYALVEDHAGKTHHLFLADITRDMVTYPAELRPYRAVTERIGVGTWDDVFALLPVAAALKAAA